MAVSMGKRENGQGTIYQRGDKFAGRIMIGRQENGKPQYKYFSGKTEGEVRRAIRQYNKENNKPAAETVSKTTVQEYLQKWLKVYKKDTLKPASYDRLERTINFQVVPEIGSIQIGKLSSDDIQKMLTRLKDSGLSYSSIKKAYDCLNACLKHAVINDDIVKNPMLTVKMLPKSTFEKSEIRYFDVNESLRIVEECRRTYNNGAPVYIYGDAYILMLNTGLRMGEAIGLFKTDWNKKNRTLHVQRNIQSVMARDAEGNTTGGVQLVYNSTKTYSGDRIIPLNKNATEALQRLCDAHPDSKNIICGAKGNAVPPERLERTFYRILKNVGLEKTGVHSLRHTFATVLFSKGVDVKTVSKLLGHASIQITLNTYIHLIDNVDHKAVRTLDNIY